MDPLSIAASIVALIQISAQVTVLIKQFRDEVSVIDTTLNGILSDVSGFSQVLTSMKETFAQEDIQADVLATGHVGSHWKNLARSLSDGETTLDQLRSLLSSVNKSTSFLDASRKQLRMKSAITQISGFREQIQSYKSALQLSLSTIIVWNQVTLQKSTARIPDRIMPNLNKLYDQIRNLGVDLNAKIGKLESTVASQGFHAETELLSMSNLRECVESAADVVSTASTTLGPEGSERASARYGSDFGDVFRKDANEPMQRWISSHTVYEYDDAEAPTMDPSEASTENALTVYESDSDSDIEHELVRALFSNGKKRKDQGDLHGAERHLRNCLSRFPSSASYATLASSQSTLSTGVSKAELLELLTETFCLQGNWADAKPTMKEKLTITERQTGKKSEHFLWDSFRLCEVLMNTKDYTEAQLHGRQALRGFKKLRGHGNTGYEKTLALLVQICNEQGNLEDEEAYAALLSSHQTNPETSLSGARVVLNMKQSHTTPSLKLEEDAPTPDENMKNDQILGSECSTPDKPEPAGKEKQPLLRELTPIPPISTRDESIPLSPSSSTSIEPWSPTTQTAQLQRSSPFLDGSRQEAAPTATYPSQTETPTREAFAKQETTMAARDANTDVTVSSTRLLTDLCQQELGQKPIFMIGRGQEGYNCIVFADSTRQKILAKAVDCLTKEEARYAAATTAYKTLVSTSASSPNASSPTSVTNSESQMEPSMSAPARNHYNPFQSIRIDPPPYVDLENPSNLTSPTGFLPDIPEITLSSVIADATVARPIPLASAQDFPVPVRRAASDSRLPQHKVSIGVHTPTFRSSGEGHPSRPNNSASNSDLPAHRRAASTSSRIPDWRTQDIKPYGQPLGLATKLSAPEARTLEDPLKRSKVQPNVTFDTVKTSIERPEHFNPDPNTLPSKSFSLFPSLAKTLSLQDRKNKSEDTTLMKKKSLRFGFSSKRKSSPPDLAELPGETEVATRACPICSAKLQGLNDDEVWSHVDNCLGRPSPSAGDTVFELPVSSDLVELPASMPAPQATNMSDLHRAFSKRDLSADKFDNEPDMRPASSPLNSALRVSQRHMLLLGDPQCGKTWLSSAVCNGTIPKHTHATDMTFRKHMGHCEVVIQDYSGFHHATEKPRRASYRMVDIVLLCFDISNPGSFENVEHKWNHEADLYMKKVPKILIGCKKDINHTGTHTVWTRDAYKLTARINARAYFETSAVTMEGLDELFNHVSQIMRR